MEIEDSLQFPSLLDLLTFCFWFNFRYHALSIQDIWPDYETDFILSFLILRIITRDVYVDNL